LISRGRDGVQRRSKYAIFEVMRTVEDIEKAVAELPAAELDKFRAWFEAFDADRFDAKTRTRLSVEQTPVEAAPIATARWGNQAVAAAASGNRPMPRATTACPLRRPATHSLTTAEATLVALAAGRAVGAAQAA
jgi:hypothetical protein